LIRSPDLNEEDRLAAEATQGETHAYIIRFIPDCLGRGILYRGGTFCKKKMTAAAAFGFSLIHFIQPATAFSMTLSCKHPDENSDP
jgi:hypothetical protein